MLVILQALTLIVILNTSVYAQSNAQSVEQPNAQSEMQSSIQSQPVSQLAAHIKSISLFRNEIQLDIDRSKQVKIGTKFTAQTSVNHKCLLIVKKIIKDLAYADATQCPGYATLRKGQAVTVSADDEVNEEIRVAAPVKSEDT